MIGQVGREVGSQELKDMGEPCLLRMICLPKPPTIRTDGFDMPSGTSAAAAAIRVQSGKGKGKGGGRQGEGEGGGRAEREEARLIEGIVE